MTPRSFISRLTAWRHALAVVALGGAGAVLFGAAAQGGRAPAETVAASAATAAAKPAASAARIEQAGIAVELLLDRAPGELPVGDDTPMRLKITDANTGEPVRGLRPRAWLSRPSPDVVPEACEARVRRFAGGRLADRADQDLNVFHFVTLNQDATLTVINPQVKLNTTKLESIVRLPAIGDDWVMLDDGDLVLVTLPSDGAVAAVSLRERRMVSRIELGGAPRRIVLQPDQRVAWVGIDDSSEVAAIDLASLSVVARVDVGEGLHKLATTGAGGPIAVTSSKAGRVTLIDPATRRISARIDLPGTPLPITWSAPAGRLYVAGVNADHVSVIDPATGRVTASLPVEPGVIALRADPSGRHVFALVERTARAWAIDASAERVVGSVGTGPAPDQIVFSGRFGYVRSLGSIKMTLIDLLALSRGELATTEIPMFSKEPRADGASIGPADMIVPSPDGEGVVVASGADANLYYYMAGMMAPQGSFQTYKRAPRALLVRDRSLREVEPGVYATRLAPTRSGKYVLPVLLDSPRVLHCFDLAAVGGETKTASVADTLRASIALTERGAGDEPARVVVTLTDAAGAPVAGLGDVQVKVMQLPGIWQQRQIARERAPGVYEIDQRFLSAGRYRVNVAVGSRGLDFETLPAQDFDVTSAQPPGATALRTR
jgi:YVTN family beta-propeller protein